jgi:hypothetical protein
MMVIVAASTRRRNNTLVVSRKMTSRRRIIMCVDTGGRVAEEGNVVEGHRVRPRSERSDLE